jgi:very-short-patch-repair endonuclease
MHVGLPITTPERTLLDLGAAEPMRELERALAVAERQKLADSRRLAALLAQHPRHPGSRRMTALLQSVGTPALTRSEAEATLLALLRGTGLRAPEANVRVAGFEVDLLWRAERLVVEVDGYAWHGDRGSFERDRRRDAVLVAAGYRVLRVTARQIEAESKGVLVRLAQALVQ